MVRSWSSPGRCLLRGLEVPASQRRTVLVLTLSISPSSAWESLRRLRCFLIVFGAILSCFLLSVSPAGLRTLAAGLAAAGLAAAGLVAAFAFAEPTCFSKRAIASRCSRTVCLSSRTWSCTSLRAILLISSFRRAARVGIKNPFILGKCMYNISKFKKNIVFSKCTAKWYCTR